MTRTYCPSRGKEFSSQGRFDAVAEPGTQQLFLTQDKAHRQSWRDVKRGEEGGMGSFLSASKVQGVGSHKSMYDYANSFGFAGEHDDLFPRPFTYNSEM